MFSDTFGSFWIIHCRVESFTKAPEEMKFFVGEGNN
jgi:hypothetical protein